MRESESERKGEKVIGKEDGRVRGNGERACCEGDERVARRYTDTVYINTYIYLHASARNTRTGTHRIHNARNHENGTREIPRQREREEKGGGRRISELSRTGTAGGKEKTWEERKEDEVKR